MDCFSHRASNTAPGDMGSGAKTAAYLKFVGTVVLSVPVISTTLAVSPARTLFPERLVEPLTMNGWLYFRVPVDLA